MKYYFLLTFILMSSLVFSFLHVDVAVKDEITGFVDFYNYSKTIDQSFQTFAINWFNSGSVICDVKIRADINDGKVIKTLWSSQEIVKPGGYQLFNMYWYTPDKGDYTAHIKIYHCYEILDLGIFNFTILSADFPNFTADLIKIKDITRNGLTLEKDKTIDSLVVIPKEYPAGWFFETKKIIDKSDIINYRTGFWEEREAIFDLLAKINGTWYHAELPVMLKEEKIPYAFYIISIIFLILFMASLFIILKKRKKR